MRVVRGTMMVAVLVMSSLSVGAQGAPATPASAPTPGVLKLAYVNSNQVIASAPGRVEAGAQFEKETAGYQARVQQMQDSLQRAIAAYQQSAASLTPAQRKAREDALGARQQEYQQRTQQMAQQAEARQEELMAPIMEQVNKVIQDIRNEDGYAFIFDAGAQVPLIVSADKNLDITQRVIDRLKTLGPPKLPAAATAPAASATPPTTPPTTRPPTAGPVSGPSGVTRPPRP
jgi:outer membrane protein